MARPKPSVRVLVSVADHPKTADVWADPYKRGMLVEIWRKAGDKFAGRNGDRVPLRPTDRMEVAGQYDLSEADARVEGLLREVGYRLDRYPNRWVVTVRNFAKRNGFGASKPDKVFRSSRTETIPSESDSDSDSKSESESGEHAPKGYGRPNGIVPMLKLNAKSTEAERSVWAEAVWPEVLAAARIESGGGSSFRDHFVKILSARWNAYLRERDPTRRVYAREARVRSLDAAKAQLDATIDDETPEADDDDPLRFMRAGGNPHASN